MARVNDGKAGVWVTSGQAGVHVPDGQAGVYVTGGAAGVHVTGGKAAVGIPHYYEAPRIKEVTLLSTADTGVNQWFPSNGGLPHYMHINHGVETPTSGMLTGMAAILKERWAQQNAPGDLLEAFSMRVRVLIYYWNSAFAIDPQFGVQVEKAGGSVVYSGNSGYRPIPMPGEIVDFGWKSVSLTPADVDGLIAQMHTTGTWAWYSAVIQVREYEINLKYYY